VSDAAPEVAVVPLDRPEGAGEALLELEDVARAPVRESRLCELPDALVGVELRCVGRKPNEVEAVNPPAELSDQLALVRATSVPEQEHVTPQVAEQVAEEAANLRLLDVLVVQLEVQVGALAKGAERNRGDRGDAVAAIEVTHDRRSAHGGPGLRDRRRQEEARFVGEDEVGTQPRGVFFSRGHSCRTNRRMAASSRSSARFRGFWWLHPSRCISRPTWSRWYRTWNLRRITSAIRAVVHSCVGYPDANAPARRIRSSNVQLAAPSLGGLPGEDRTRRPFAPPARRISRHRITELAEQPIWRATSFSERPSSRSPNARRRRSSNNSAEPRSRIVASGVGLYHSLCRCR
jgi:hypothetical protein